MKKPVGSIIICAVFIFPTIGDLSLKNFNSPILGIFILLFCVNPADLKRIDL